MQTKLAPRLDDALIKRAKARAHALDKSLSQMVSGYFTLLNEEPGKSYLELPPLVRSLKGALHGNDVGRSDYLRYLEEKHR